MSKLKAKSVARLLHPADKAVHPGGERVMTSEAYVASNPAPVIVYDGECPFCTRYVALLKLREAIGPVKLINAREGGPVVERLRAAGYDLDEGMVLEMDGKVHHGMDAINRLALLSTDSTVFNRLNAMIFRSRAASAVLYPMLRFGRNTTLRLMGRTKLADHAHEPDKQPTP